MRRWIGLLLLLGGCIGAPGEEMNHLGEQVYRTTCARCHDKGEHGAQRIGDRAGWRSRLSQDMQTLVKHSIDGFEGAVGHMPARGGDPGLSNREVAAAVRYLVKQSR